MDRFSIKVGYFDEGYKAGLCSDGEYVKYEDIKGTTLNKEQRKSFEEASRPLMEWLSKNYHPHVTVILDSTRSELLEGVGSFITEDYI